MPPTPTPCPSAAAYQRGCRCDACTAANADRIRTWRNQPVDRRPAAANCWIARGPATLHYDTLTRAEILAARQMG